MIELAPDRRCHRPAARPARRLPRPARLGRGGRGDVDDRRAAVDDAAVGRAGRRAPGCSFRSTRSGNRRRRCRPTPTWRRSPPSSRTSGSTSSSTLPLYAAFLDEPFDASPYAPVSRAHWNEVYLDDAAVPAAPTPTFGDLIDWQALARRRRRQLLAAASDLDPYIQSGVDRFVAGASGRRRLRPVPCRRARAGRRRPPGRADRAQPHPRPVPRQPAAVRRRRSRPRRPGARPADRQPPGRLRDMGVRRAVRRWDDGRRTTGRVLRRRTGLGLPAAAAGRRPAQRTRPVATTSSPGPASTPRCCASTT